MYPRTRRRLQRQTKVQVDPNADLRHIDSFKLSCHDQLQSALFSVLPAEMRDLIYEYVFAEYEDLSNSYNFDTCYRRPDYMAPRITDTALLRTCQLVYNAAWYLPWTSAQHTFFLAQEFRKPSKATNPLQMARTCALIQRLHPNVPGHRKAISHIQVFAQLYRIEQGGLPEVLNIPYFMPRTITITIRHTDIWYWETDEPIHIGSPWVSQCRLPSSVNKLRMQIESLQRKKEQVDCITSRLRNEWCFTRTDDVQLTASNSKSTSEVWKGSSTWQGQRWIRDEDDNEPGVLQFYIVTINFQPEDPIGDAEGHKPRKTSSLETLRVTSEIASRTRINSNKPYLSTREMAEAGVRPDTPASEALRMVQEWQRRSREVMTIGHLTS
ncbi:hypothetical protein H2198_003755 [Neophaeococcomyces mojaviensis]|uniref:Uncharacterized protein n=1 Tax=Neophaeococcomyces mojaviensis TaxID=3383035 RepID=A0ACC3AAL3_9EURO|nr:hypothetical protein H2198_003755 [Knufia sp. JES_112]